MISPMHQTWLAGLFGRGISGSKARFMHEHEAGAMALPLVYRIIDFEALGLDDADLGKMLALVQGMGFVGLNITHPYKQAVIPFLDVLSPDAEALGAVNTVRFVDGKLHGHNTDWSGFVACVRDEAGDVFGGRIAQIGAGGAGSATAYGLLQSGADEVALFDPDVSKARDLADRLAPHFPGKAIHVAASAAEAISGAKGVVQTSPVGMASHPGLPFDPAVLEPGQWLSDVIYFPRETELVTRAKARGVHAFGGLSMAIHQAAGAFEIFTDHKADPARMLAAYVAGYPGPAMAG